jgi:hypothetical protein
VVVHLEEVALGQAVQLCWRDVLISEQMRDAESRLLEGALAVTAEVDQIVSLLETVFKGAHELRTRSANDTHGAEQLVAP